MKKRLGSLLLGALLLGSSTFLSYAAKPSGHGGSKALTGLKKNLSALIEQDPSILNSAIEHYLETKPESIYSALVRFQKNEVEKQQQATANHIQQNFENIFFSTADGVMGDNASETTLLILSDRSCGFCRKAWQLLKGVSEQNPQLRIAFKEIPILGKGSVDAAKIAIWAQGQNRFEEVDLTLNQIAPPLETEKLIKAMAQLGISENTTQAILTDAQIESQLAQNAMTSEQVGLQGTPMVFIAHKGSKKFEQINNFFDVETLNQTIKNYQEQ